MLGNAPYYHKLMRKYVSIFGTLFNDITIERTNDDDVVIQSIPVPLSYSPKEKFLAKLERQPNLEDDRVSLKLPRMGFEIINVDYDPERKTSPINRKKVIGTTPDLNKYQYNPVPWNMNFQLSIASKTMEDGLNIIEQILPFFTPEYTVTAELIPEMSITKDIPIVITSAIIEDTYEGDFDDRRVLIWTLDFIMKGWLYGPVKESKIIKFVDANVYANEANTVTETVHVEPSLLDGNNNPVPVTQITADDNYTIDLTII